MSLRGLGHPSYASIVRGVETAIQPDADAWNERYQRALAMPEVTLEQKLEKYTLLNNINRDFISAAVVYAKTIISEYFISDDCKSLPPQAKQLGMAGGVKYKLRGILFKLADGSKGPYDDNDENAAKAMGHEIKGANSYFRCAIPGLHLALQALIDYKGFRMHAQALLPIDANTLVVGTSDSAQTVHCKSLVLQEKLKFAAQELNLHEHVVKGVSLHSACDIEGHQGADNRFYIIDLARAFPPESPYKAAHLPFMPPDGYRVGQKVLVKHPKSDRDRLAVVVSVHSHDISDIDDFLDRARDNSRPTVVIPTVNTITTERTYNVKFRDGLSLNNVSESEINPAHQSIFWRLLRPEFVKHRGRRIIAKYYDVKHEEEKYPLIPPPSQRAFSNSSSSAEQSSSMTVTIPEIKGGKTLVEASTDAISSMSATTSVQTSQQMKLSIIATEASQLEAPEHIDIDIDKDASDDYIPEVSDRYHATADRMILLRNSNVDGHPSTLGTVKEDCEGEDAQHRDEGGTSRTSSTDTASDEEKGGYEPNTVLQPSISSSASGNTSAHRLPTALPYHTTSQSTMPLANSPKLQGTGLGCTEATTRRSTSWADSEGAGLAHLSTLAPQLELLPPQHPTLSLAAYRKSFSTSSSSSNGIASETDPSPIASISAPGRLQREMSLELGPSHTTATTAHGSKAMTPVCLTRKTMMTSSIPLPEASSVTQSFSSGRLASGAVNSPKTSSRDCNQNNVIGMTAPNDGGAEQPFDPMHSALRSAEHDLIVFSSQNDMELYLERRRSRSGSATSLLSVHSDCGSGRVASSRAPLVGQESFVRDSGVPALSPTNSAGSSEAIAGHESGSLQGTDNAESQSSNTEFAFLRIYRYYEKSYDAHSSVVGNALSVMQLLNLPYGPQSASTGKHGNNTEGPTALSPDAFTVFTADDKEHDIRNREVHEATAVLCSALIPALAKDLIRHGHPKARQGLSLSEYLHGYGVNMRHAGLLRSVLLKEAAKVINTSLTELRKSAGDGSSGPTLQSPGPVDPTRLDTKSRAGLHSLIKSVSDLQAELLIECLSRTLKNMLRERQRKWMKSQRTSSEQGLRVQIVDFLNLVTGAARDAKSFWEADVSNGLVMRFGALALRAVPHCCLCRTQDGHIFDVEMAGAEFFDLSDTDDLEHGDCSEEFYEERLHCRCSQDPIAAAWTNCTGRQTHPPSTPKSAARSPRSLSSIGSPRAADASIVLSQLCTADVGFRYALIPRLCTMCGIRLTEECRKQLDEFQTRLLRRTSISSASFRSEWFSVSPASDPSQPQRQGALLGPLHFEFVAADVEEIVPVVKAMHQLDLCEGKMLSIIANSRQQAQHEDTGIVLRLVSMATDRLRRALRAVPDDIKTRQALADAYLTEGAAHVGLISKAGLRFVVTNRVDAQKIVDELEEGDLPVDEEEDIGTTDACMNPTASMGSIVSTSMMGSMSLESPQKASILRRSLDLSHSTDITTQTTSSRRHRSMSMLLHEHDIDSTECERIELANRAYKRYAELQLSLEHTRCAMYGLSYREDILGITLVVTHFKEQNSHRGSADVDDASRRSGLLPIARIATVKVELKCVSLQYFIKSIEKWRNDAPASASTATLGDGASQTSSTSPQGATSVITQDKRNGHSIKLKETSSHSRSTKRFFPLIIDEEHALRSLPLLQEEILRLDRLNERVYEFPVDRNQPPVVTKEQLKILPLSSMKGLRLPEFDHHCGFRVLSAVMNSTVLLLCENAEKGKPVTDEAIAGYMRMHHMLLFLSDRDPRWREEANRAVEEFIKDETVRTKEHTKDLGRFLINLLISDRKWDEKLADVVFNESLIRQVSWFVNRPRRNALIASQSKIASSTGIITDSSSRSGVHASNTILQGRSLTETANSSENPYLSLIVDDSEDSRSPRDAVLESAPTPVYAHVFNGHVSTGNAGILNALQDDADNATVTTSVADGSVVADDDLASECSVSTAATASITNTYIDREQLRFYHPELAFLETDAVSPYRLLITFEATKTSLRMFMFQVYFLRFIARKDDFESQSHVLKIYNSSLGRPTAAMHSGMREEYDRIMSVRNYEEFLQRVGLSYTPAQLTCMLRNAVRRSVANGYTDPMDMALVGGKESEPIPSANCNHDDIVNDDKKKRAMTAVANVASNSMSWKDVFKEFHARCADGTYDRLVKQRKLIVRKARDEKRKQQSRDRAAKNPHHGVPDHHEHAPFSRRNGGGYQAGSGGPRGRDVFRKRSTHNELSMTGPGGNGWGPKRTANISENQHLGARGFEPQPPLYHRSSSQHHYLHHNHHIPPTAEAWGKLHGAPEPSLTQSTSSDQPVSGISLDSFDNSDQIQANKVVTTNTWSQVAAKFSAPMPIKARTQSASSQGTAGTSLTRIPMTPTPSPTPGPPGRGLSRNNTVPSTDIRSHSGEAPFTSAQALSRLHSKQSPKHTPIDTKVFQRNSGGGHAAASPGHGSRPVRLQTYHTAAAISGTEQTSSNGELTSQGALNVSPLLRGIAEAVVADENHLPVMELPTAVVEAEASSKLRKEEEFVTVERHRHRDRDPEVPAVRSWPVLPKGPTGGGRGRGAGGRSTALQKTGSESRFIGKYRGGR